MFIDVLVGPINKLSLITAHQFIFRLSIEEIEVLQKQRAEELFTSFKEKRYKARKRSEEMGQTVEQMWEDQEKKSKSFELKKKQSFVKARERLKSDSHLPELLLEKLPDKQKTVICERMSKRRTLSSSMSAGSLPRYQFAPKHLPRVKDITSNSRPSSRAVVVKWFRSVEKPKGVGLEADGTISEWMHGKLRWLQRSVCVCGGGGGGGGGCYFTISFPFVI